MPYSRELKVVTDVVFQASLLAKKMQRKLDASDRTLKEDLSPVTIIDFTIQALLNLNLSHHFPNDEIVGEEDALILRANEIMRKKVHAQVQLFSLEIQEDELLDAIDKGKGKGGRGRFWTIDPIDGTKGFIRGDQFAVGCALIEDGEVVLSVMGCPRLQIGPREGAVFFAVKGTGTKVRLLETGEEYLLPKKPAHPPEFLYCEQHEGSKTHSHEKAHQIAGLLQKDPKFIRLDSQCKYAFVAHHFASMYLRIPATTHYIEKIWDHAPGQLIVEEAGGIVTDVYGKKLNFTKGKTLSENTGIIATAGFDHKKVVQAALEILDSQR